MQLKPELARGLAKSMSFALLAIGAFVLGRVGMESGSSALHWLTNIRESRRIHAVLSREWPELASTGSSLGGTSGVTLVEFSDYECPFCRRTDQAIDSALRRGAFRVVMHHFPIVSIHPAAEGAARAAICAEQQGRFAKCITTS